MLKIENVVLPSPEQWEAVIRGMRNSYNSWSHSDSSISYIEDPETLETASYQHILGDNDLGLMNALSSASGSHRKYLRMIPVFLDITAPLYWWKEFDTYKVGTVANSCSTMHTVANKEFTLDDFSVEYLKDIPSLDLGNGVFVDGLFKSHMDYLIGGLNFARYMYNKTGERLYWDQIIQLLPTSYNQKRTVFLSYEVLKKIFEERHAHKLREWHTLCDWITTLPHSEIILPESREVDHVADMV